ncbi:MAG: hypothetical protein ILA55_07225 [Erysipelotrichaceae bacterium]|nr:hypothetical protein [Erysipelotrichaceae bacterium]
MNSDKFVYYDADFLAKFKKLAEVMEEKDKAVLHRYLIDNFSHIFKYPAGILPHSYGR